jgi:hypothetical protein
LEIRAAYEHVLSYEIIMIDPGAIPTTEPPAGWVGQYVAACLEVLTSASACLEVANVAVAARNKAAERPQHEISIRNFTEMAERQEREFAPLYRAFVGACTTARDIAAGVLAAYPRANAEMDLMVTVQEDVLDKVATAKEILRTNFAPMPAGFVEGVDQANALMQAPPEGGNIYTPLPPVERTCPWCAETIKVAAVVCLYCGRDVQTQPSSS